MMSTSLSLTLSILISADLFSIVLEKEKIKKMTVSHHETKHLPMFVCVYVPVLDTRCYP